MKCTLGVLLPATADPLNFVRHDEILFRRKTTPLHNNNPLRRRYMCATAAPQGSSPGSFATGGCQYRVCFERADSFSQWRCSVATIEHTCAALPQLTVVANGAAADGTEGRKKRRIGLTESSLASFVSPFLGPQELMRRKGHQVVASTMATLKLPAVLAKSTICRAVADCRAGAILPVRQSMLFFGVRNDFANLLKFGPLFSSADRDNKFHLESTDNELRPSTFVSGTFVYGNVVKMFQSGLLTNIFCIDFAHTSTTVHEKDVLTLQSQFHGPFDANGDPIPLKASRGHPKKAAAEPGRIGAVTVRTFYNSKVPIAIAVMDGESSVTAATLLQRVKDALNLEQHPEHRIVFICDQGRSLIAAVNEVFGEQADIFHCS